jgi:NADP-dependent aldehyde dehydrogenase
MMTDQISGRMLIGQREVFGTAGQLQAFNPATGQSMAPPFGLGADAEVDQACRIAAEAFDAYCHRSLEDRAAFLEAIAEHILEIGETLIMRAHEESGLSLARLEGERARTVGQLRLFARVVREGGWLQVRMDRALPARSPQPRPDLRMQMLPLGPVAVFGASNFPLAFSVAGGDTAAALAAGCPVVFKAHPAHPGTSELVGKAICKAVARLGLPPGVFSLLFLDGNPAAQALVAHPDIAAVAFTGSRAGGQALMRVAAARAVPVPVYAEMSSVNPVFVLPNALERNGDAIAAGFVEALTLGAGQFCTNPGWLLAIESPALDRFRAQVSALLETRPAQPMLTPGILQSYRDDVARLGRQNGVRCLAQSSASANPWLAQASVFECPADALAPHSPLADEVFGASSLLAVCRDEAQMLHMARQLEGQLTATLHVDDAGGSDDALASQLLPLLERRAGRIVFNGFPTGVEVCDSMVHGGPYPSTSDGRSTSVGSLAIDRFLRPVCYQGLPAALQPPALRDDNPFGLCRRRDNVADHH